MTLSSILYQDLPREDLHLGYFPHGASWGNKLHGNNLSVYGGMADLRYSSVGGVLELGRGGGGAGPRVARSGTITLGGFLLSGNLESGGEIP